jgi:arylsulfatase A-like enzyme
LNLVVYVSDALRTDYVGCYGARRVKTPTIDELAATGARFDQVIAAAPWTCPSTTSMITGLYPHHHRFLHWDATLDPAIPTLFSVAAANGYATGSFVFDEDYLFKSFPDASVAGTSETLDGAVEWLRAHRDRPFVLWFHSWATHLPYDIPHTNREWKVAKNEIVSGIQSDSAAALEALREKYAAAVERSSEHFLACFLEELDALGLRDDTAFAFAADHGESWGERFADKRDVRGTYHMHGATLFEEIVEVPLILSVPGRVEPGTVIPEQVSLVDLTPTLLDLAGAPLDGVDGVSLLPRLAGEAGDTGRAVWIAGTDGGRISQLAVRRPPWKLLVHVESGEEEAYRLDVDPREQRSVPAEAPAELRELLYAELATVEQPELSAEDEAKVESRLADLGYL